MVLLHRAEHWSLHTTLINRVFLESVHISRSIHSVNETRVNAGPHTSLFDQGIQTNPINHYNFNKFI